MSDLVIPPGYGLWQFTITHATIAHKAVVTMGFKVNTPPYTQAQSDSALANFALAVKPIHDNEVSYTRVVTLIGNDGPAIRFESIGAVVGTHTAQTILPPNVSYLIKKTTAFAGRRFRGRMYLPFVGEGAVSQTGTIAGADATALTLAGNTLLTGLVGSGPNSSELDILHAESPLSALPSPTAITALSAELVVATQRRRLERS